MRSRHLWNAGKHLALHGLQRVEAQLKQWTQPAPDQPITGGASGAWWSPSRASAQGCLIEKFSLTFERM